MSSWRLRKGVSGEMKKEKMTRKRIGEIEDSLDSRGYLSKELAEELIQEVRRLRNSRDAIRRNYERLKRKSGGDSK